MFGISPTFFKSIYDMVSIPLAWWLLVEYCDPIIYYTLCYNIYLLVY